MAIDNNSRLTSAINKQGNNAPSLGCGAVYVKNGVSLPAGDYVAVCGIDSTTQTTLDNIVWKGEPILDATGGAMTGLASLVIDTNRISGLWYLNIESCDVTGGPAIFYKRCR